MTNVNLDELGKALGRQLNASRFTKYVKERLEETMSSLTEGDNVLRAESIDISLLLIFTYINLMGFLSTGKTPAKEAVHFFREYLGRIDPRYKEVGGLLYDALRHGMVHLATPKRIQLLDGRMLDFSFTFGEQREEHLKITKNIETELTGDSGEICRLCIGVSLLYKDLLSAMDEYAGDIRRNQALSDTFWQALKTRRVEESKETQVRKKPYIQESDFDFVRRQVLLLSR